MSESRSAEVRTPAESHAPGTTRAVRWIIAVTVALYFLQLTVVNAADVQEALGFHSRNLGHAWWTAVTFMFVHGSLWHLAFNMFVLWLFGPHVEWRWGTREFLRFYLFAGLGGWIAHLALVGGDQLLIGATAPVLGVLAAYGNVRPNTRAVLFGVLPVTTRWLTLLAGATLVAGSIAATGEAFDGSYLAHLGGVAAALLYLRIAATVNLQALRQSVSPVSDEPDDVPPRAVPRAAPRTRAREREDIDDVVARTNAAVAKRPPARETQSEPGAEASALDALLDKIAAHGIDSLSRDERRMLEEASRRLRDP